MTGAEHFAAPPAWEWWIVAYFFFGGIAGGSYAIGTLTRLLGTADDQRLARIAFVVSVVALVFCPIFLIADLGQPGRFLNMLVDPAGGLVLRPESPMSVGSWALLFFGLFAGVSFLGALGDAGVRWLTPVTRALSGAFGTIWTVLGTVFGLFVAGYTGVLLSVSNQPVWSDAGWVVGGLFLASGLTGASALLLLLVRAGRAVTEPTAAKLEQADRSFTLLEGFLIVLFLASVLAAGTVGEILGIWLALWLVVVLGIVASFIALRPALTRRAVALALPFVGLLGVFALRVVVILSAQA